MIKLALCLMLPSLDNIADPVFSPPTKNLVISKTLQAAIDAENANPNAEQTLAACELIYATQGEGPFDPLNPADMLCRAFVLE